ncbi:hypothetical protein NGM10_06825 [Halorussus salilacus]|uniref:hypothetical protein n=1 Tax=Halorussus salilacus TaxID=2953750 RepID=UPI00209C9F40|nr:hypothetical protein [Halorussus salilacus]USZ69441.1 hypothetical protein NGM10_06825 [Halorussus salilacus]
MVENNPDHSDDVSNLGRRTVLKATSGALVGVGLGGVASASGDGKNDERVEGEVPYPDHSKLLVDDSLTSLTPRYHLLTVDEDRLLELVEAAKLDEADEQEARDSLKDLWSTYEVRKVRDGKDFVLTLDDDGPSALGGKDEAEKFSTAGEAVSFGFAKRNGGRNEIGAQWYGSTHKTMTRDVLESHFDLYSYEEDDIVEYSPKPDTNPCDGCGQWVESADWPSWVKDAVKKGLNEFAHHYGHYYDPNHYTVDLGYGITIEFNGLGGAPWFCEYEMGEAEDTSYSTQREHLGRAIHYVQDVSVPLHSGMGIEQMNLELDCDFDGCEVLDPYYDLHYSYEEWVKNNLTSGENFLDDCTMIAYNNDPFDCVENVADEGNSYAYEVFHLVKENGTDFDSWSSTDYDDLVEATANSLSHGYGYTHALVEQLY